MAIIRSLVIGKGRKSLGEVTLKTVNGVTIASQKIVSNKSNTYSQQFQRSFFRNAVKWWKSNSYNWQLFETAMQQNRFTSPNAEALRLNNAYLRAVNDGYISANAKTDLPAGLATGVDWGPALALRVNQSLAVMFGSTNAAGKMFSDISIQWGNGLDGLCSQVPCEVDTISNVNGAHACYAISFDFAGLDPSKLKVIAYRGFKRTTPSAAFDTSNTKPYEWSYFSGGVVTTTAPDSNLKFTIYGDESTGYRVLLMFDDDIQTSNDIILIPIVTYDNRLVAIPNPLVTCKKEVWGKNKA